MIREIDKERKLLDLFSYFSLLIISSEKDGILLKDENSEDYEIFKVPVIQANSPNNFFCQKNFKKLKVISNL